MQKSIFVDKLKVEVYENRTEMGVAAAERFHSVVIDKLKEKENVNVIFAAAPSQNDFLESIKQYKDIDWKRINVFHMDEYVGLSINSKQSFARFVKEKVVDVFGVKEFYPINGAAEDAEKECERYAKLLSDMKVDIVCCGIGENGHLAFNDPHVAYFDDKQAVKIVLIDEVCRNQQVHDGCFESLDLVPKAAITLTLPTLMAADEIVCVVPCSSKANAVEAVVKGEITTACPATILRTHKSAVLYCDKFSAEKI